MFAVMSLRCYRVHVDLIWSTGCIVSIKDKLCVQFSLGVLGIPRQRGAPANLIVKLQTVVY